MFSIHNLVLTLDYLWKYISFSQLSIFTYEYFLNKLYIQIKLNIHLELIFILNLFITHWRAYITRATNEGLNYRYSFYLHRIPSIRTCYLPDEWRPLEFVHRGVIGPSGQTFCFFLKIFSRKQQNLSSFRITITVWYNRVNAGCSGKVWGGDGRDVWYFRTRFVQRFPSETP